MTPLKVLRQAVAAFEERRFAYCLAGGHAASLYRSQERLTRDVDFAILANPVSKSQKQAEAVLISLGLKPMLGFIPIGASERDRKSICMVSATPIRHEANGIIDILLPALPWVTQAVKRAQHNKINLGFAAVPVITPEDLILAKSYALANSPDRFQDLDDIKEIFKNIKELDLDYLLLTLNKLEISIPEPVRKFAPARLL